MFLGVGCGSDIGREKKVGKIMRIPGVNVFICVTGVFKIGAYSSFFEWFGAHLRAAALKTQSSGSKSVISLKTQ